MISHFRFFLLTLGLLFLTSCATQEDSVSVPDLSFAIPSRSAKAMSGQDFAASIGSSNETQREARILEQFKQGNVPDFLRRFATIRFKAQTRSGQKVDVVLWATADYMAIGSDQNFVRVPMNPLTAQEIADRYRLKLPTAKIVDIIYQVAPVKLAPQPFKPGRDMVTVKEFVRHNQEIQKSLALKVPTQLTAGHKKDIVISNRLLNRPRKLAIYGWHRKSGGPIQPLSTVHGQWYADYSHGVRLVSDVMLIGKQIYSLSEVLSDPELAPLVSYEGVLTIQRYPTQNGVGRKRWWPQS